MTVLVRHFPAVYSSEPLLTHCKRQKLILSCAMSLSETSSLSILGYSNSLRVTHPDVVIIGLLCVDVARTFGVPQGSGSLCLHVLLYKQVLWEEKKVLKKTKQHNNGRMA